MTTTTIVEDTTEEDLTVLDDIETMDPGEYMHALCATCYPPWTMSAGMQYVAACGVESVFGSGDDKEKCPKCIILFRNQSPCPRCGSGQR